MSRKPGRNRRRRAMAVNRLEARYRRRHWLEIPGAPTFFRGFQEKPLHLPHRHEWQAGTRTFATEAEAQAFLRLLG